MNVLIFKIKCVTKNYTQTTEDENHAYNLNIEYKILKTYFTY